MKYAFIHQQCQQHSIATLCRVIGASRSGYYASRSRPVSARHKRHQVLLADIRRIHTQHKQRYGGVKTWKLLQKDGVECGKHQVLGLRRKHGIVAKRRRRFVVTTRSKYSKWLAPNLLNRNFTVHAPDVAWVGDVTFIPTAQGWLYLAVLIDLYARFVVGWAMSERNNTPLVIDALQMALERRRPARGLIVHTDQGQTYAAKAYRDQLEQHSCLPSMSRKGDCWDNAVAESFFATVELELLDDTPFETRQAARRALFEFMEIDYNRNRPHQTLGYQTPAIAEQNY